MEYDPHGYGRKLRRALALLPRSGIHPASQNLNIAFHDDCFSDGLSTARVEKYVRHLVTLGRWTSTPLDQVAEDNVKQMLSRIQGSDYAEWTKHDLRLALRKFLLWMRATGRTKLDAPWIKIGTVRKRKLPNDLPTLEEVNRMVRATRSPRNRAFIMLLYETGARIGELARLQMRDVTAHPHSVEIHLPAEGKRGARRVLAVASAPHPKAWLNVHPNAAVPHAYVWPTRANGQPLGYTSLAAILSKTARAAGVTRKVNPHNFRHARATYLANHLTEAQMSQFFGWIQGSDTPSTYVHLSGRDVDKALLRCYGIHTATEVGEAANMAPRRCAQCNTGNPATNSYCGLCGLPPDADALQQQVQLGLRRSESDEALNRLMQDGEFRNLLERKLKALSEARA